MQVLNLVDISSVYGFLNLADISSVYGFFKFANIYLVFTLLNLVDISSVYRLLNLIVPAIIIIGTHKFLAQTTLYISIIGIKQISC